MPDELSIYNAALLEIGQSPLTSVDDTSAAGVQCRVHYADARDATLELHPWNFATMYATLARSGTTPAMRWRYQYPLPTGSGTGVPLYCLAVRDTDKGVGTRWEIGSDPRDGRVLFSNEASLVICYTARLEDLGQWSRLAIQVLIKMLASKLAKPLTGQLDVEQAKLKEALALLPAGAERDTRETGGGALQVISSADTLLALYNEVLGELGLAAIADPSEQTLLGQHLRRQFPAARDATLELHPWHFATVYATLTVSTRTPAFRWRKQYKLPELPFCLVVRTTDKGVGTRWEIGYDPVDGRVLYNNEDSVSIEYTGRMLDLTLWDSLARQVLVKVLASKVALALVHSPLPANQPPSQELDALGKAKWEQALQLLPAGRQSEQRQSGGEQYQVISSSDPTLALANEALSELGLPAIADLAEQTVLGQHLHVHLPAARDATLELHPWHFATVYATLTASPRIPPFRWAKQYLLPMTPYCLVVRTTNKGVGTRWEVGYDPIDGRVLYSNEPSLSIEYTGRVLDLAVWDTVARQVFVKVLASKLAHALVQAPLPAGQQPPHDLELLGKTLWEQALQLMPAGIQSEQRQSGGEQYQVIASRDTLLALYNEMLGEIGVPALADPDEATVVGQHLRTQFAAARDTTLTLHPWHFASVYATLTTSTRTPPFRWAKQYLLPMTPYCLVVRTTNKGVGTRWEVGYDPIDGRVLYSNEPSLSIEYTGRILDLAVWDPLARQVLVKVGASKLALALVRQPLPAGQPPAQELEALAKAKWDQALQLLPAGVQSEQRQSGGERYQALPFTDATLTLINEALGELGLAAIADLAEATVLAQHARLHYPAARDSVLQMAPWHFATVLTTLTASTTVPPFRWAKQYRLPTTPACLTVLGTDEGQGALWEVGYDPSEGAVLWSNKQAVKIAYIAQVTDLARWQPLARQVLVKVLASKLAQALADLPGGVVQSGQGPVQLLTLGQRKWQEAQALLQQAGPREVRESVGQTWRQATAVPSADLVLDVWNESLGELGLPPLQSQQEETVVAQQLRVQYAGARDTTLTLSPWPFARFQATLTLSSIPPTLKWLRQYRLPTNPFCLTVLGTDQGTRALYEIGQHPTEGHVLLSNALTVQIEYLGRVEDLAQWQPLARQVLVKVLASKVAQVLAAQATSPQADQQGQTAFVSLARTKWDEALSLLPAALRQQRSERQPVAYRTNNEATTATATLMAQRALGVLGEAPLADIDELTVVGFACRVQLAAARDAVLELHPWNFAKKQAALAALPKAPQFKWDANYVLPADCLTVLGTNGGNGAKWEIGVEAGNTRVLYSDKNAVSIEYIFRQTNYAVWSALALEVLVKMLAARLAAALARDLLRLAQELGPELGMTLHDEARVLLALGPQQTAEAQALLREARDRDGREGYPVVLNPNRTLVMVRGRRGGVSGALWEAPTA